MRRRRAGALLAALSLALVGGPRSLVSQDTTIMDAAPVARPAIDSARLEPVYRLYDMLVRRGDSVRVIGQRSVAMLPAFHATTPGWRVVETRTGAVPAADSLWVSLDGRPLYWSARVGPGRLTAQFANDTLYGSITAGRATSNLVIETGPSPLATSAWVQIVLGTLPLTLGWSDSARVLSIDPATAAAVPAEILVVAEETVPLAGGIPVETWVVALRTAEHQTLYWVEQRSGIVVRAQQRVPPHVGDMLEYRVVPMPPLLVPLIRF